MKKFFLLSFLLAAGLMLRAAVVDTVFIYSASMQKSLKCVVISPFATGNRALPVVYLLHGYSGDYASWIKGAPALKEAADQYHMYIVCPDGQFNSWYMDSPVDSSMRFETYISQELPAYIDAHYHTIASRSGRAITGLSMGGHGGLYLGFRHSDFYGACGSMSGGVDLRPFTKKWDLVKILGDSASHPENWKNYSVTGLLEKKPALSQSIIIDCGVDDFFYTVNRNLHNKLLELKISHDFIERPGEHNWAYWKNAVEYQLLFFHRYFEQL